MCVVGFLPNGERPTLRGEPQSTGLLLKLSPPSIKLLPPDNFSSVAEFICGVVFIIN